MVKTVFSFNPVTKEYVGQCAADESPLEPGNYLVPAFATTKEPPSTADREVAVFDDVAGDWMIYPDFRSVPLCSTVDGSAVTVTEIGAQPDNTTDQPRPSIYHDWDGAAWGLNLNKAQAAIWELIKAERDRRKAGGFKVGTDWFHSDADSRIQHLGLKDKARDLLAAGGAMTDNLTILGQPVRWKTMDGSFAIVTAQLAFDIVAAAGDLDARLFAVAETHRAAMEAAADPAAYDFSVGWPATFAG